MLKVISCVSGATKELIENSLDAGATAVEIRNKTLTFKSGLKRYYKKNFRGILDFLFIV